MVLTVVVAVVAVIVAIIVVIIVMILLKNHRPTPSPRMVIVVIGIRRSTITVMGTVPITSRRHGSILIPGAYGGCPMGRNWNVRYSTTTTTTTNIFLLLLTVRTGILRLEYDIFYQFDGYPNQFFVFQRRLRLWLECACSLR
jgi:hypothetical protein